MGAGAQMQFDGTRLAELCRRHGVSSLSLFGSAVRGELRADSDVDVLVEFEPEQPVGYFELVAMEDELSVLLGGRKVDLRTPLELSRYFRDQVVASAEVQYAGG